MIDYKKTDTDVIVIGGGLTGTLAAYLLAKSKKNIIIVRDGRGASPHVAGFNVAGAEKGDSAEIFINDTIESAKGQADRKLVEILCRDSMKLPEFLKTIGFEFDTFEDGTLKARKSLGSSYSRVVGKGNSSGADILSILDSDLKKRGNVTLLEHSRAVRLFKSNNRVTGALVFNKRTEAFEVIQAHTVLLASGGYAGIFPFTSNSKDISGDTVAMALLSGAHATDMEFVQFEPSCAVWPLSLRGKGMITTLFYEGAVLTNSLGERFMLKNSSDGERVNKDVLARCIAKELREGRQSEHGGVWFDSTKVDPKRLLSAYEPFVTRYKNVGIDLMTEAVEVANAAHTSLGGVKVNDKCESDVLGLFAAGEALGNLHGVNRIGGSAGTETLVFSKHVAEVIKNIKAENWLEITDDAVDNMFKKRSNKVMSAERMAEIKAEASELIGRHLGVEREEAGLKIAAQKLEEFYNEVRSLTFGSTAKEVFEYFSLENFLITAVALAKSALLRDDSAGSHLRIDHTSPAERIYRTDVRLENGTVCVSKIYK